MLFIDMKLQHLIMQASSSEDVASCHGTFIYHRPCTREPMAELWTRRPWGASRPPPRPASQWQAPREEWNLEQYTYFKPTPNPKSYDGKMSCGGE